MEARQQRWSINPLFGPPFIVVGLCEDSCSQDTEFASIIDIEPLSCVVLGTLSEKLYEVRHVGPSFWSWSCLGTMMEWFQAAAAENEVAMNVEDEPL